eukprot:scpid52790/ scgid17263/ 
MAPHVTTRETSRHTHMPSSSSHQLSPAPAAVTAASKLQQHGWQQCSSGHCGGMSVDIQHFTASASEAQGNCVASPNSETFAGVRVRCPRFEACAAFRLKGLKSGPTIPVGFIQVVEERSITATYSSPSGDQSCDFDVIDNGELSVPPPSPTPSSSTLPASHSHRFFPFFDEESVAFVRPVSSRSAGSTAATSSTSPMTSRTSPSPGSSVSSPSTTEELPWSLKDDERSLSQSDVSGSGDHCVSLDEQYVLDLPWCVDSTGRRHIPTTPPTSQQQQRREPSQCAEDDAMSPHQSSLWHLTSARYSCRQTTWLAAYDPRVKALIPVGAVQQHVNFTLTASLSKPIGQRVAYAAGPCSLERLQPTPQIPSSALQQQVSGGSSGGGKPGSPARQQQQQLRRQFVNVQRSSPAPAPHTVLLRRATPAPVPVSTSAPQRGGHRGSLLRRRRKLASCIGANDDDEPCRLPGKQCVSTTTAVVDSTPACKHHSSTGFARALAHKLCSLLQL